MRQVLIILFLLGLWPCPGLTEELIGLDEADRAGYISYEVTSLASARGEIAQIQIVRKTKDPITIVVPPGMVFRPEAREYSLMIIGQEHLIPLIETKTTHILKGYSLDYPKAPPRKGMPLSRAEDGRYEDTATLIMTGNDLGQKGFFYPDLPPDEYKGRVIQAAIWVMSTNYGYNRAGLREEVIRDFGEGKTAEEIDALTDHLWTDTERVVKETRRTIRERSEKLFHIKALNIERSPDPDWPSDKIIMELWTSERQGYEPLKNKRISYKFLITVEPKDGAPRAWRIEGKTRTYADGIIKIEVKGGLGQNLKRAALKVIDLKEIKVINLKEIEGEWRYDPGHPKNQEALSIKF